MKLLLVVLAFAPMAYGFDLEATKAMHAKYCELKVAEACSTIKCTEEPEKCEMPEPTDKRKAQLTKQADEIKKRCPKEDDHVCMLKENKDITKEVLEMDCIKGDQTACYFIEVSKSL